MIYDDEYSIMPSGALLVLYYVYNMHSLLSYGAGLFFGKLFKHDCFHGFMYMLLMFIMNETKIFESSMI